MSCRTGPLLAGRSLRDVYTLTWQVPAAAILPMVGTINVPPTIGRPLESCPAQTGTPHEVVAPRDQGARPAGTKFFSF
jgi:hypothetical protein